VPVQAVRVSAELVVPSTIQRVLVVPVPPLETREMVEPVHGLAELVELVRPPPKAELVVTSILQAELVVSDSAMEVLPPEVDDSLLLVDSAELPS
jgi:hypothetical protein